NSSAISFGDGGPAAGGVYPSFVKVSGVAGTISKVTARLIGLSHTWTPDLDFLLVGPQGQTVVLMSDAGQSGVSGINLVFDDEAAANLPASSGIVSGTFKPTNIPYPDSFAFPAPPEPYGEALSVFKRTNPNGAWKLFVMD